MFRKKKDVVADEYDMQESPRKWKVVAMVLILVGLLALLGYMLLGLSEYLDGARARGVFDRLESRIVPDEEKEPVNPYIANPGDGNGGDVSWEEVHGVGDEEGMADLVDELQEEYDNEDIVGYIHYEEAGINYAVVQGDDNLEYIRKSPSGRTSVSGSIILDVDNDRGMLDTGTIIYGHHMNNGSMFGKLESHVKKVGIGEKFYIYTGTEKITYRVISYEDIDPMDRESWIKRGTGGEVDILSSIRDFANSYSIEGLGTGNRFVTLVTCRYSVAHEKVRFGVTGVEINREPYIGTGR